MCFRPAQVEKPIKCPNCGALNPFNRMTCKKCNSPLNNEIKMVHCPKCGRDSLVVNGICDDCGLAFDDILQMIKLGEIDIEDVIVHADGSRLDWSVETFDLDDFGGSAESFAKVTSPIAPVATPTIPKAPKAPGVPKAPSAPVD